ncbi:MAG: RIP metalloprotease RseP [Syntrophomonadaceae bacterium]|nr:RIP metalloprotease RseP [Syntrophomonadaceae bacterium]
MNTAYTILITVAIIAVLILVHEFGHFVVARRIGIPVWEFSLGFGPRLIGTKKNGTEYSIRAIPLGGYVRMAGEEPGDGDNPDGYSRRTPLEKMAVSFAGPFMNLLAAMLIFVYIYSVTGVQDSANTSVIGQVMAGTPAQSAGLKAGDEVVAINGASIRSWEALTKTIGNDPEGKTLTVTVDRSGKTLNIKVTPLYDKAQNKYLIGVKPVIIYQKMGIVDAVKNGFQRTWEFTVLLLSGIGLMISGGASMNDLAGPVGITKLVGQVASVGWSELLAFSAFLSINLGILNLLPIPALDGSRIIFAVVEGIRRKPLAPEKEGLIHWIGFVFLIGLMIIVTFNDIVKLYRG